MLGKVFALCTDEEQAQFLNEAGVSMRMSCGDVNAFEMQLMRIVDRLNSHGRKLVKDLAAYVKYDEDQPQIVRRVVYQDVIAPVPSGGEEGSGDGE